MKIAGDSASSIALSIEEALYRGRLAAGQPLPTVRDLARRLKVSPATVAAAYRLLHARGLTMAGGRRGTRVRPHAIAHGTAPRPPIVIEGMIDLASGNPDPALLPPIEAALRSLAPEQHMYGDSPYLRALTTFAAAEFAADGIPAGSMAVTSGALDALERVLREHLRPGDTVAIEDPTLPALIQLIGASGISVVPIAVDADGPIVESFERALAARPGAVVLTPRAQNPTGAAISAARAAELKHVLRTHPDVLLIENDPAGPVASVPAVTLIDHTRRRWMIVRSVSKFLGPDLRLAVVTGDDVTIARIETRQALSVRWVSHILQRLALAMWSDPSAGRHLARAAEIYAQRRRALIDALAAEGIEASASSGFNVWIPVREEADTCQALAARGWTVAAGEAYRIRSTPGIRVTTSALAPEEARRFARDFAAVPHRAAVARS